MSCKLKKKCVKNLYENLHLFFGLKKNKKNQNLQLDCMHKLGYCGSGSLKHMDEMLVMDKSDI